MLSIKTKIFDHGWALAVWLSLLSKSCLRGGRVFTEVILHREQGAKGLLGFALSGVECWVRTKGRVLVRVPA